MLYSIPLDGSGWGIYHERYDLYTTCMYVLNTYPSNSWHMSSRFPPLEPKRRRTEDAIDGLELARQANVRELLAAYYAHCQPLATRSPAFVALHVV